jgi:hypothetical protein
MKANDSSAECHVPANFLNDGIYSIDFVLTSYECGVSIHFYEKGAVIIQCPRSTRRNRDAVGMARTISRRSETTLALDP